MKRIKVAAVGRVKEEYYNRALAEYAKRISRFAKLDIAETEELTGPSHLEKEAELITPKLSGYIIVLDREGKMLDSEELAQRMDSVFVSRPEITFVIGGSDGLYESVKSKAQLALSFGRVTLTHSLARVVLYEQIYRTLNILAGGKYHK